MKLVVVLLAVFCASAHAAGLRAFEASTEAPSVEDKAVVKGTHLTEEQKKNLMDIQPLLSPNKEFYVTTKQAVGTKKTDAVKKQHEEAKGKAAKIVEIAKAIQTMVDSFNSKGNTIDGLKTQTDLHKKAQADLQVQKGEEHQGWATKVAALTDHGADTLAKLAMNKRKETTITAAHTQHVADYLKSAGALTTTMGDVLNDIKASSGKVKDAFPAYSKAVAELKKSAEEQNSQTKECKNMIENLGALLTQIDDAQKSYEANEAAQVEWKKVETKKTTALKTGENNLKKAMSEGEQLGKAFGTEIEKQRKAFQGAVEAVISKIKAHTDANPEAKNPAAVTPPKASFIEVDEGAGLGVIGSALKEALTDGDDTEMKKMIDALNGLAPNLYGEDFNAGGKFSVEEFKKGGYKNTMSGASDKAKAALDAAVKQMDIMLHSIRQAVSCISRWVIYKRGLLKQVVDFPDLSKETADLDKAAHEAQRKVHDAGQAWQSKHVEIDNLAKALSAQIEEWFNTANGKIAEFDNFNYDITDEIEKIDSKFGMYNNKAGVAAACPSKKKERKVRQVAAPPKKDFAHIHEKSIAQSQKDAARADSLKAALDNTRDEITSDTAGISS